MSSIVTHGRFHYGDNLLHLHFLRALVKRDPTLTFTHAVPGYEIPQLHEVIEDLPQIKLVDIDVTGRKGVDGWKNVDGFWDSHSLKNNFCAFYLNWFGVLATRMGLVSPFSKPNDLLFDYPAIQKPVLNRHWDFLVINSRPGSGQLRAYESLFSFDPLIARIAAKHKRVACTQPTKVPGVICTSEAGVSITGIGNLSLRCDNIFGVSTGPSWPTFNVWNKDTVKLRLIMVDKEQLGGLSPQLEQVESFGQAEEILEEKNLI